MVMTPNMLSQINSVKKEFFLTSRFDQTLYDTTGNLQDKTQKGHYKKISMLSPALRSPKTILLSDQMQILSNRSNGDGKSPRNVGKILDMKTIDRLVSMYKQRSQVLLTYARMNSLLTEFQKDDLRNSQGQNSRLDHISRLKDDIANFEAQHQDIFGKIIN